VPPPPSDCTGEDHDIVDDLGGDVASLV